MAPALSVLDLSPVTTATPPSQALRNSIDLARHVDGLGFLRYWLAEHHNLANVATTSPAIMIGQVAQATSRIRVGSGGVMLPNHAPLTVAENFRTLEALFPGRIDLGLGRAPGTDQPAMVALRRRMEGAQADDFVERLQELIAFGTGSFPERHPFSQVMAMPTDVSLPPVYILGSSNYGAHLAAAMGLGYAFAHHFASYPADQAMRDYRDNFRPSIWLDEPYPMLGVSAVCAPSDEEAEFIAATVDLAWFRIQRGERAPLASPEAALALDLSPAERDVMRRNRARHAVGSPVTVRARLEELAAECQVEELIVTSNIFDHEQRKRSYRLLAEAFGLPDRA
ncbi:LLM class flavin-dependent oxidoreductase [Microbaculum marinum]|uniref:Luciferase-like monooxygenase n=1 Tax=Microbaculum marinum TaxID=1764581 RepID=A0AAW9RT76_9HYPH